MTLDAAYDVSAPRSTTNIVQEVTEYVIRHSTNFNGRMPTEFEVYDRALGVVWPGLHKASPMAHLLVGISVYIDIAERWGFEVPGEIRTMKL